MESTSTRANESSFICQRAFIQKKKPHCSRAPSAITQPAEKRWRFEYSLLTTLPGNLPDVLTLDF